MFFSNCGLFVCLMVSFFAYFLDFFGFRWFSLSIPVQIIASKGSFLDDLSCVEWDINLCSTNRLAACYLHSKVCVFWVVASKFELSISTGSVATYSGCGGIYYMDFVYD